jgi:hypothetical protein
MNRNQLQKILNDQNINPRCYSLGEVGLDPDERLCLRQDGGEWIVFYSERGLQSGKQTFPLEDQACVCMLTQLIEDPTTRDDWRSGFQFDTKNGI